MEKNPPIVQGWCSTKSKFEECTFLWTIDRYKYFYHTRKEKLTSPIFSVPTDENCKWCIKLEPNHYSERYGYHCITLYLKMISVSEILARFQFSILDSEHKRINTTRSAFLEFTQDKEYCFKEFIERDLLFEKENSLLPDDRLTILCEITIVAVDDSTHNTPGQHCIIPIEIPPCNLSVDFTQLFESKDLYDVILSVNGEEFKAHKSILAARSVVFKAMFQSDMKEGNMNRVEITDIESEVFHELLRYIYTGNAQNIEKVAVELLAAANKYDLMRLKLICQNELLKSLSIEKAADILVAADLHQAEKLKAGAIRFIKLHSADVMNTEGWRNVLVNHSNLVADMISFN